MGRREDGKKKGWEEQGVGRRGYGKKRVPIFSSSHPLFFQFPPPLFFPSCLLQSFKFVSKAPGGQCCVPNVPHSSPSSAFLTHAIRSQFGTNLRIASRIFSLVSSVVIMASGEDELEGDLDADEADSDGDREEEAANAEDANSKSADAEDVEPPPVDIWKGGGRKGKGKGGKAPGGRPSLVIGGKKKYGGCGRMAPITEFTSGSKYENLCRRAQQNIRTASISQGEAPWYNETFEDEESRYGVIRNYHKQTGTTLNTGAAIKKKDKDVAKNPYGKLKVAQYREQQR